MAKLTYLALTNRVLARVPRTAITDVTDATGTDLVVTNLINEAIQEIYNSADWYSLYTTRTFDTVADTAEYPVPSDFGRGIDLIDTSNNRILQEEYIRTVDQFDPDADSTGTPLRFSLQGSNYRFYPIPSDAFTIRERYWKEPAALSVNADEYDLPKECENAIIQYSLAGIKIDLKAFPESLAYRADFEKTLKKAKSMNNNKINKMDVLGGGIVGDGILPPSQPSNFGIPIAGF